MPDVNIPAVPAVVLKHLNAEAKKRGVGTAAIVIEAVAATFHLDAQPAAGSSFKGGAQSPDGRIVVNIPSDVRDVLRREGPGKGGTLRAVVINSLCDRYGLERVPEGRQPRQAA